MTGRDEVVRELHDRLGWCPDACENGSYAECAIARVIRHGYDAAIAAAAGEAQKWADYWQHPGHEDKQEAALLLLDSIRALAGGGHE